MRAWPDGEASGAGEGLPDLLLRATLCLRDRRRGDRRRSLPPLRSRTAAAETVDARVVDRRNPVRVPGSIEARRSDAKFLDHRAPGAQSRVGGLVHEGGRRLSHIVYRGGGVALDDDPPAGTPDRDAVAGRRRADGADLSGAALWLPGVLPIVFILLLASRRLSWAAAYASGRGRRYRAGQVRDRNTGGDLGGPTVGNPDLVVRSPRRASDLCEPDRVVLPAVGDRSSRAAPLSSSPWCGAASLPGRR